MAPKIDVYWDITGLADQADQADQEDQADNADIQRDKQIYKLDLVIEEILARFAEVSAELKAAVVTRAKLKLERRKALALKQAEWDKLCAEHAQEFAEFQQKQLEEEWQPKDALEEESPQEEPNEEWQVKEEPQEEQEEWPLAAAVQQLLSKLPAPQLPPPPPTAVPRSVLHAHRTSTAVQHLLSRLPPVKRPRHFPRPPPTAPPRSVLQRLRVTAHGCPSLQEL